jgi:hypothetical protein
MSVITVPVRAAAPAKPAESRTARVGLAASDGQESIGSGNHGAAGAAKDCASEAANVADAPTSASKAT